MPMQPQMNPMQLAMMQQYAMQNNAAKKTEVVMDRLLIIYLLAHL